MIPEEQQGEPVCAVCGHKREAHVGDDPNGQVCAECDGIGEHELMLHPYEPSTLPPAPPSSEEAEAQGTAVCAKCALPVASELHEPHIQPVMDRVLAGAWMYAASLFLAPAFAERHSSKPKDPEPGMESGRAHNRAASTAMTLTQAQDGLLSAAAALDEEGGD